MNSFPKLQYSIFQILNNMTCSYLPGQQIQAISNTAESSTEQPYARSFTALALYSSPVYIHAELIAMIWVSGQVSSFVSYGCPVVPATFTEKTFVPQVVCSGDLLKSKDQNMWV